MSEPTADDARRIAQAVVGEAPSDVVRFTTGAHHYVYEVSFASRPPVVARIAKPSERYAIEGAIRLSTRLRPLGVPLPALLASNTGETFPWMLLERLPGRDLGAVEASLGDDQLRAIAGRVAAAQAIVASTPTAGRYGYASTPEAAPHRRWIDVPRANLDRSRQRFVVAGLFDVRLVDEVERRMVALEQRFDAVAATPFLHDTTTKNVIVNGDGVFSGIVDVDDLCFGDPRYAPALTLAAMNAYGTNTQYVGHWLDAAGFKDDELFRLYVALFLLDLMGEYGQVFNGNERPLTAETKRRLEQRFDEAIGAR